VDEGDEEVVEVDVEEVVVVDKVDENVDEVEGEADGVELEEVVLVVKVVEDDVEDAGVAAAVVFDDAKEMDDRVVDCSVVDKVDA
jgi:hypothetical protein